VSRVLVTGAAGQLGSAIVRAFSDHEVIGHTRATLDVSDPAAVHRAIADAAPSVIINCAAYNAVDAAEEHPLDAFAVNAIAVRSLARAAEDSGAAFVHYGTDFVFDGDADIPYSEESPPSPRSVYAMSKLVGEWFALESPRGFVLRVESLFGTHAGWAGRRGTLDGLVEGMEQGRPVKVFTDRVVSPSYVVDIAAATRYLVESGSPPGLYHCVNSGHAPWFDVATETARLLGLTPRLQPVTMDQVRLKAPRPRFCALANRKLADAGFPMPHWRDALARWIASRDRNLPAGSIE
jgi:dTDP-4-dehydrorhamnose reductase